MIETVCRIILGALILFGFSFLVALFIGKFIKDGKGE